MDGTAFSTWLALGLMITGNIYYVGSKDLASCLIVTPKGDVLINSRRQVH